ncbi:hypothetical protein HK405_005419 [Cladochytrium tenue]|nr:hypothetical protein HK405_005419 [Cladochytrium tenue]
MPASSPAFGSPEEADDRLRSALAGPVKPSATASAKATEPLPAAAATSGPAGLLATAASSSKSWAQLARQAFLSPPESSEPSVSSSGTASPEHLPRVLRVSAGSEDVHTDSHSEQTGLEVGDSTSDSLSVSADSTAASGGENRPPVLHDIPGPVTLPHDGSEETRVGKPSADASDTGSVVSQADESLSSTTLKETSTQPVGNVWKMRMQQQQQQQSPSQALKFEASSKDNQQADGETGSFRPFNHSRRRPQYTGVRPGVHDHNGPKEVQSEDLVDEDGFVRVQRKKPHANGAAKDGKPHYHNHYQGHTHQASPSVQQKPGRKEAEKVETKVEPTQVATSSGTDPDKTAAPTLDSGAIGDTPVPTSSEESKVSTDTQKPVVVKKPSTPVAAKIVQVNARSENLLKESKTSREAPAGILSGAWPSLDQNDGNEAQPGVAQSEVNESITVPASDSIEPLVTADGQAGPTKDNGRQQQRNHPRNNSNGPRAGGHGKPLLRGPRQQNAGSQLMYGQQQHTPNPFPQAQIANGYPVLPGAGLQPPFGPMFHGFPPAMAPGPFLQGGAFMNSPRPSKPFASRGSLSNAPVPDVIVPPGETMPVPVSSVDLETCVSWIRRQVEYYFSIENLCRDLHLRAQMSPVSGAVPLRVVAGFSRVRNLVAVARVKSEAAARAQSKQQQQQQQEQQPQQQTGETTPAKAAAETATEPTAADQPVTATSAPSKPSGAPLSAPKTRGLDWAIGLIIDALVGSDSVNVVELTTEDWARLGMNPPAKRERGVRMRENWETWILPAPNAGVVGAAVIPPGVQGPPLPAATAYLPQFSAVTHQPPLPTQHAHHHHVHHAHPHHQHPHGAAAPYPMYMFPFPRPPHGAPIAPHPHGHHPYQYPTQQNQQHHQQQAYLSVPSQPPTPTAAAAALATPGSAPTVTQPQQQQQHSGRRRNNSQSGGQHHHGQHHGNNNHHHGHHHHGHSHSHTQPGAKQQQQQQPVSPAAQAEPLKGQEQQQPHATEGAAAAVDNLA